MRGWCAGVPQALPRHGGRAGSGGAAGRGRTGWATGGNLSSGLGRGKQRLCNGQVPTSCYKKKPAEAWQHCLLWQGEARTPGHVLHGGRTRPPSLPTRRDESTSLPAREHLFRRAVGVKSVGISRAPAALIICPTGAASEDLPPVTPAAAAGPPNSVVLAAPPHTGRRKPPRRRPRGRQ